MASSLYKCPYGVFRYQAAQLCELRSKRLSLEHSTVFNQSQPLAIRGFLSKARSYIYCLVGVEYQAYISF